VSQSWSEDQTLGSRTSVRDVLVDAERRLQRSGVPSPAVDAAEIVATVLGTSRSRLFLLDAVSDEHKVRIEQMLALRLSRVPLQHLTGTAPFRRMELQVGPGVFIPRPETELVAEAALRALMEGEPGSRLAVDLCAGSGAVGLSLATECPGSVVHAVERDDAALEWTRLNLTEQWGSITSVGSSMTIHHADATMVADEGGDLAALAGLVDVVVSNPPYIPDQMIPREPEVRDHEPKVALYGGPDGLDVVRGVARSAAILLRPGGVLVIEHADVQGQAAGVLGVPDVLGSLVMDEALARRTGARAGDPVFSDVVDRTDLNGLPRFTLARRIDEQ
jgi:release factor glutamine methyltransferase